MCAPRLLKAIAKSSGSCREVSKRKGYFSLAVDDVGLLDLTQTIEDRVGEFSPFESNLEAPVWIIKNGNVLSGDRVGLRAWRNQIDDFVVLDRRVNTAA
jgi:hypothetical protein